MTVPADTNTVSNPTTGQAILASWGDAVRDSLEYLLRNRPHCRVTRTSNQSLTNATWTDITFANETFDVGGLHSTVTNTNRITIPSGEPGKYALRGHGDFDNSATGLRGLRFLLNGATAIAPVQLTSVGFSSIGAAGDLYPLVAGDYLTLQARQDSGGSLNLLAAEFSVIWMAA